MKRNIITGLFLLILALLFLISCTTQKGNQNAGGSTVNKNTVNTETANIDLSASTDITGRWEGKLNTGTTFIKVVFRIIKDSQGNLHAFMDSPDQGAYDIPVRKVTSDNGEVIIDVAKIKGKYSGKISKNKLIIEGTWKQSGISLPLKLSKITTGKSEATAESSRPQEPEPPYPYKVEDAKFTNKQAGFTLSGTLTYPNSGNKFPAVVLISGSGSQNRNEEIFGHKPFLVIADYLTRNGIAVLRYDDRGFAESGGNAEEATSLDYAEDAYSAFKYLKSKDFIDKENIGLIGHSEGALIASYLASKHSDISFIVLLAGPGVPGKDLLLMQSEALLRAEGASDDYIKKIHKINKQIYNTVLLENNLEKAKEKITKILKGLKLSTEQIKIQEKTLLSPWYRFFLSYDPKPALEAVKCPVLALAGSLDTQVPAEINIKAIKDALEKGGNTRYTVMELEGLNHLFQPAKTGLPGEYARIKETFSKNALKIIADWIKKVTNS